MALEQVGIKAVVENYQGFTKAVDNINSKIADIGKKATATAKQNITFDKSLSGLTQTVNKFTSAIGGVPAPVASATGAITDIIGKLGILSPAAMAGVAAVAALATAFVALGMRGAAMRGIIESFDRLTQSIGITGDALLKDLRTASAGTVRDMDLLRVANLALAGAVGQFGKEFGSNLPKILEIARVQARATGQDVDFLFQSLIMGIKRGSPLLIDNTGLVLKVSQAQQDYATSIGKTVEQLTTEEKQIALLNATLAAGETAIANLGDLQETAAEKIARANATISNIFDRLALAVQPAFEQILDVLNRFLSSVGEIVNGLAPIIGGIVSIITQVITNVLDSIGMFLEPFKNMLVSILPYIGILVQGIQRAFAFISDVVKSVFGGVVRFITDIAKNLFGIDVNNLGKNFFEGAAAIFGSFANGIAEAANKLIFPVVIGIATFIADLLVGQSPPPKGPLSKIDKGGANTMMAWLDGFTGVSLDPVDAVVAQVNASLGSIGALSLNAVNKRLAQLDAALLPFQQRLDIVKSQFEAISAPAQAALNAIDRQLEQANEALLRGEAGAAERVRALDNQRESILAALDAQQAQVDNAEIQLALMKAMQSQERALLNIRKAQLPQTEAAGGKPATPQEAAEKAKKEAAAGGGAADVPVATGGGGISPADAATFPTLDELLGQGDIDAASQGIAEAFLRPLAESGNLQELMENSGLLGDQLSRLGNLGGATGGIAGAFNSIGNIFNMSDPNSPLAKIKQSVEDLFNPDSPNSINAVLTRFGDSLANSPLVQNVSNFFSGIFDPEVQGSPAQVVKDKIDSIINPDREGSIPYALTHLGDNLSSDILSQGLITFFSGVFDPTVIGSPAQLLLDWVDGLVNPTREGSIPYFFGTLPQAVSDAASGLFAKFDVDVITPIRDFLTGEGEGTLNGILQTAVGFFADFPNQLVSVLKDIGTTLWMSVAVPIIGLMNGIIESIENTIRSVQATAGDLVKNIAAAYGTAIALFMGEAEGTKRAQEFMAAFGAIYTPVSLGRISTAMPSALNSPDIKSSGGFGGAATGGIFGGGVLRVGERGEELIASANKLAVFPNNFVRAIDTLSQVLAQSSPMPMATAGSDNRQWDQSINANFYGVQGANDVMRRFNSLRAWR